MVQDILSSTGNGTSFKLLEALLVREYHKRLTGSSSGFAATTVVII